MTKKKANKPYKWKNEFYVTAYILARSGSSNQAIAKAFDITPARMREWVNRNKDLRQAIERGRKSCNNAYETPFLDYASSQFSPETKAIWDKMQLALTQKSPEEILELANDNSELVRQELFVLAWMRCGMKYGPAARITGVCTGTLNKWKKDPQFAKLLAEMTCIRKQFVEDAFMGLVHDGNPIAVLHASRTLNADFGYGDKSTVEVKGQINHAHAHAVIDIDSLDLPLEVRKQILQAVRKQSLQQDALEALPPE